MAMRAFLSFSNWANPRFFFAVFTGLLGSGCQFTYIVKSGYHQAELLARRTPLEKVLAEARLSPEELRKLRLAQDALVFAEQTLNLKVRGNYGTYVHLDRPYVTWAVTAAHRDQLKAYLFKYPLVGALPYKGFFSKEEAEAEARALEKQGLDTYTRGVSAYSTLGWFNDPILSTMLRYDDEDLVNLLIHESVHATLFVKSAGDFNERLATFLGNVGTEAFYLKREGPDSETLKRIRKSSEDDRLYSDFLSRELRSLEVFYASQASALTSEQRQKRLDEIIERYKKNVQPLFKATPNPRLGRIPLNNAVLISQKTYLADLSDFEKVFISMDRDYSRFLDYCHSLASSPEPEKELKKRSGG